MGVRSYDNVQITGLSDSGTADNLGAWNTSVDLDTFVTIPAGATGVILRIDNTGGSPRWAGVRTPGKTNAEYLNDTSVQISIVIIAKLGPGNTIDLYQELGTSVKFYILGVTDSRWTFTDIDTRSVLDITAASFASYTLSPPAGQSIVVLNGNGSTCGWRPYGSASSISASIGTMVGQLDGSNRIDLRAGNTTSDMSYIAWVSGGVNFMSPFDGTAEEVTADSAWHTSSYAAPGKSMALLKKFASAEDTIAASFRKAGSSFNVTATGSSFYEWLWVPLNESGQFDYWVETGLVDTTYNVMATFDDFQSVGGPRRIRPATMLAAQAATVAGSGSVA